MYETGSKAKRGLKKAIDKCGYTKMTFVIVERKLTKAARDASFNFRRLVNEPFNSEWHQLQDKSFCRMIEEVVC